jgi:glycosyltransferase involved in cell wall biosynthesis
MGSNIGIYNLHMRAMGGGEKLTLVLAEHLSLAHNVWLFCSEPLDLPSLERFFGVDLSRVTVRPLNKVGLFLRALAKVQGRRGPLLSLHHFRQVSKLNLDIFINNSYASGLVCPATRGIFMCMFPHPIQRVSIEGLAQRIRTAVVDLIEQQLTGSSPGNNVDSYSMVIAISRYSADWVRRRWGRRSEIIYPPCDDMGPPAAKARIILNVGRFIAAKDEEEWHHKGQQNLLEAFKRMSDLHKDGWELHFTGSVGIDNNSAEFAQTLVQDSGGFPVRFHFNAAREEMSDLYRRAAIYWHATGYGFDADTYPVKQEHFGITTVEAMSAGAVPVVYSSGGQKEIVTDGVDGFWWADIDGLINQTRTLANDQALLCEMSSRAVLTCKRFEKASFTARIDQVIGELLSEGTGCY